MTDPMGFLSDCTTIFSIVNRGAPTETANSCMPKIGEIPSISILIEIAANKRKLQLNSSYKNREERLLSSPF